MSAVISRRQVAAILGSDFPLAPPATFASVWEKMKIVGVYRNVRDILPDDAVPKPCDVPVVA